MAVKLAAHPANFGGLWALSRHDSWSWRMKGRRRRGLPIGLSGLVQGDAGQQSIGQGMIVSLPGQFQCLAGRGQGFRKMSGLRVGGGQHIDTVHFAS